jgi:hypothetical protein
VVFGAAPVERAKQTGVSARTIFRKVGRFDELGMQRLFEAEPVEDKRALPVALRQAIIQLKPEDPAFRPGELATICQVRFEPRPSHATIKQILFMEPVPEQIQRRFSRYAEMADPLDRRLSSCSPNSNDTPIRPTAAVARIATAPTAQPSQTSSGIPVHPGRARHRG